MKIKLDERMQQRYDELRTQPTFLSIVSGKGGVGKSTVAVNLAISLAEKNVKVGLIDADIYGFSIPSLMQVREEPITIEGTMLPIEKFGVKLMSSGFLRTDNQPIIMRGPMLGRVIKTFLENVQWGELDYLIFDLPPGTGDIPLDIHEMVKNCKEIIVTTPNDTAAEVAFRAGAMTARTGHDILGIVENMSYIQCPCCTQKINIHPGKGGHMLSSSLEAPLLAQIPMEATGSTAPASGVYHHHSIPGQKYRELADQILLLTRKTKRF
ncbi:Mrp/NBP35 family ATP-binding protein [Caldalkalibacillus mannanilyticus]|uniref:Mrp/NBP35 family ATP-binding protein n=1 Tax=Caldalkalibacillus mannanilyticus TaxID=1418 RepID=UPI00046A073E|nr:Mrp/NBP35 family ATP-binding protein [Caldalkalibacillus mannanilyticus]